jgi:hypothetical protein
LKDAQIPMQGRRTFERFRRDTRSAYQDKFGDRDIIFYRHFRAYLASKRGTYKDISRSNPIVCRNLATQSE